MSAQDTITARHRVRAGMAGRPQWERGTMGDAGLGHYQLAKLPVSALQMPLHCPPQAIEQQQQLEQQALASLQHWGVVHV